MATFYAKPASGRGAQGAGWVKSVTSFSLDANGGFRPKQWALHHHPVGLRSGHTLGPIVLLLGSMLTF